MRKNRQTVTLGEPTWTTGHGQEIPLSRMEVSHILNCIDLLSAKRNKLNNTATFYNEVDNPVVTRQLDLWDDSIKAFFNELRRRGNKMQDDQDEDDED